MKKQLRALLLFCILPLMLAISNTPSLYAAKNTEFKETIKNAIDTALVKKETIKKTIKQAIDTAQVKAELLKLKAELLRDKTKKFITQHKKAITKILIALSPFVTYFTYKSLAQLFSKKIDPNIDCEKACGYKDEQYNHCTSFKFYENGNKATSNWISKKCKNGDQQTNCFTYNIQKNDELRAQQNDELNQIIKNQLSKELNETKCAADFDKHIKDVANSYCPAALDSNKLWDETKTKNNSIERLEKIKAATCNKKWCSETCKNLKNNASYDDQYCINKKTSKINNCNEYKTNSYIPCIDKCYYTTNGSNEAVICQNNC